MHPLNIFSCSSMWAMLVFFVFVCNLFQHNGFFYGSSICGTSQQNAVEPLNGMCEFHFLTKRLFLFVISDVEIFLIFQLSRRWLFGDRLLNMNEICFWGHIEWNRFKRANTNCELWIYYNWIWWFCRQTRLFDGIRLTI